MKNSFKNNTILLIVDPQYDFFPGGSLAVPHGDEIIPVINTWLQRAQSANIPVMVSRDWHPTQHCSFKPQGGPWPAHCVQNTPGAAIHQAITLPSNSIIINKATAAEQDAYSALSGKTDKEAIPTIEKLQQLQINHISIAGLALDYCVQATALEARQAGFQVTVILPGCRAITEKTGAEAIANMQAAGIEFIS